MVPSFIPRLFLTLATAFLPLFCVAADSASQSAGLYTEAVEAIAVGLITILLLVIIANVLLYFTNRQKRMAHQRIEDATVSAILQQKSKSMYFSNMTHEIRTPLNAIAGFCDLLAEPSVDDDTRKEAANIIAMNSNNFRRLIDDVLQSSSTSSPDNFDFTYVSCDAIKLGRNVVNMLSHINKTDANITFSANKEMFPIVTDSLRLQQVMINVMTNAMKFCKRGTINLNINADDVKNEITFTVTDTGVGIPKDKAKKIFKRFEKVSEQAYGFGIGLSLCKIIMQRLGGDIWVDENYTNGARFVFNQPYVAVENAQGRAGTVNASILLPLLFLAALPPARSIAMTVVLFLGLIALICVLIYALYHRMKSRKLLLEKESIIKDKLISAKESDNEKKQFLLHVTSHINVALQLICDDAADLAKNKDLSLEERKEMAEMIKKNANILLSIANNVLDLSRLEAVMMKYNMQTVNLYEEVNMIIYKLKRAYPDKEINFTSNDINIKRSLDVARLQMMLESLFLTPIFHEEMISMQYDVELKRRESGKIDIIVCGSPYALISQLTNTERIANSINKLYMRDFNGEYLLHGDTIIFRFN